MSKSEPEYDFTPQLRTSQLVAAALVSGAFLFLALVMLLPQFQQVQPLGNGLVLTWISLASGAFLIVLSLFLPDLVAGKQRRMIAEGWNPPGSGSLPPLGPGRERLALAASFQTRLIVRLGFLEGGTFFSLMAYMLERHWLGLLVAVVLLGLMAANFPTRQRMEDWTTPDS